MPTLRYVRYFIVLATLYDVVPCLRASNVVVSVLAHLVYHDTAVHLFEPKSTCH